MLDSKGEGGQLGIPWGPARIYKYIFSSGLAGWSSPQPTSSYSHSHRNWKIYRYYKDIIKIYNITRIATLTMALKISSHYSAVEIAKIITFFKSSSVDLCGRNRIVNVSSE